MTEIKTQYKKIFPLPKSEFYVEGSGYFRDFPLDNTGFIFSQSKIADKTRIKGPSFYSAPDNLVCILEDKLTEKIKNCLESAFQPDQSNPVTAKIQKFSRRMLGNHFSILNPNVTPERMKFLTECAMNYFFFKERGGMTPPFEEKEIEFLLRQIYAVSRSDEDKSSLYDFLQNTDAAFFETGAAGLILELPLLDANKDDSDIDILPDLMRLYDVLSFINHTELIEKRQGISSSLSEFFQGGYHRGRLNELKRMMQKSTRIMKTRILDSLD